MNTNAMNNEKPDQTKRNSDSESNFDFAEDIQLLWHELRKLNHMHLRLAALEAQQAGISLVVMIVAGIMMVVLLSVAWFGFLAAGLLALNTYEILTDNILLILLAVILNLFLAWALWKVICGRSNSLRFPATIRSLRGLSIARRIREICDAKH